MSVPVELPNVSNAPVRAERFYRPELDALRFVAFLGVFLYHASFLPNQSDLMWAVSYTGAFGMSLFFVLSSYLITKLLIKERDLTGKIKLRFFYARRALRIWPLYFAFLFAVAGIGMYHQPWHVKFGTIASFSLLSGNWYLILRGVFGPVMPLWSLSVEEQFYAFWPALFSRLDLKWFIRLAIGLIPASLVSVYLLAASGRFDFAAIWWNTLPQMQFFGIGALLAIYDYKWSTPLQPATRLALALAGILVWLGGGICNQASRAGLNGPLLLACSYICGIFGCLLLFRAFFGARRIPSVFLNSGKISYGLYVFHMAALGVAGNLIRRFLPLSYWMIGQTALALLLTFLAAHVSYRFLEKPFLKFKRHFEIIHSR